MPTKSLPAASLRTTDRLPAARIRLLGSNYLIFMVLWPIRRLLFGVESYFLPALREGRSADQALGAGRDVVEGEGHRDAGVKAHQADHVGDADMVERLRFGDGARGVFDSTSYSSCDFAGLSGQFANFAVFLRDLKPVSRRCADPSSNVSASRSNSFAVRNRASQMTGLPALSANSRYQWASSRNLRRFSCRSCVRGWSMASVVAIGAIISSPRQPIYPAWLEERARDRRGSRSRRCGHRARPARALCGVSSGAAQSLRGW